MPDHAICTVPQRGQRVRVTAFGPQPGDGQTRVPIDGGLTPGDEGTVLFTDSLGTVHVEWDSGGQFGLIPGQDEWETVTEGDPAADLLEHVRQAVTDLVEVCQRLPVTSAGTGPVARTMDRLGEECAEAAARIRALPTRPREAPGYTFAAAAAILAAAEAEHDFGGWLAGVLCQAAARLGSSDALVMGRSGSWEAEHVLALVRQTAGWRDEHLSHYADGKPQ